MAEIDPSIFKAYDIRGIYPGQLDETSAALIARAFVALLQSEASPLAPRPSPLRIAVGMDMRLSSPDIKKSIIEALLQSGIDVDDIGLVSTPTYYFAVAYHGYDGGIQISASHNPAVWNGLKIVRKGARALSNDTGIFALRDMIVENRLPGSAGAAGRSSLREEVLEEEAGEELKEIQLSEVLPFRVVADAANAMGALYLKELWRHLPGELIPLNFELDGTFPVHEADPLKPENMRDLAAAVVRENADLGIATDGDGDRIFFVDEKGEVVPPHILRGILAQIELREHPGAKVAYDIRPGRITRDMIEDLGGKPVVTPVGHSLIKEIMIRENAIFGGESSGHFYYAREFGTFEMPMLLTAKLLLWLSKQEKPFSEAIAPYKKYAHSGEINFHLPDRAAIEKKIEEITALYAEGEQSFVDGVSIECPDYWFNVRASNTEPLIRLTVEARDREVLERETGRLKALILEA